MEIVESIAMIGTGIANNHNIIVVLNKVYAHVGAAVGVGKLFAPKSIAIGIYFPYHHIHDGAAIVGSTYEGKTAVSGFDGSISRFAVVGIAIDFAYPKCVAHGI